jgi:hypothetical protein
MDMVRESAAEIAQGNAQLTDNLVGSFAYHSRNAGRFDLGGETPGETMMQGWQRSTTGQLSQSFRGTLEAFAQQVQGDMGSANPDDRRAAAIAASEMQNMLPSTTGDNQTVINQLLAALGVDHNITRTVSVPPAYAGAPATTQEVKITVEEQLANIASGRAAGDMGAPGAASTITGQEVAGLARQWGSGVPVDQRTAPTPTPTPTPGP